MLGLVQLIATKRHRLLEAIGESFKSILACSFMHPQRIIALFPGNIVFLPISLACEMLAKALYRSLGALLLALLDSYRRLKLHVYSGLN